MKLTVVLGHLGADYFSIQQTNPTNPHCIHRCRKDKGEVILAKCPRGGRPLSFLPFSAFQRLLFGSPISLYVLFAFLILLVAGYIRDGHITNHEDTVKGGLSIGANSYFKSDVSQKSSLEEPPFKVWNNSKIGFEDKILQNQAQSVDFHDLHYQPISDNKKRGQNKSTQVKNKVTEGKETLKSYEDLDAYIVEKFNEYVDASKRRVLVWNKTCKGGCSSVVCFPEKLRGDKYYRKLVKRAIKSIPVSKYRDAVKQELTVDREKYPTLETAYQSVAEELNRYLTGLFYELTMRRVYKELLGFSGYEKLTREEKREKYNELLALPQFKGLTKREARRELREIIISMEVRLPYVVSLELQGDGYPHFHAVFFGVKRLGDWKKLETRWGMGFQNVKRCSPYRGVEYALKYATKSLSNTVARRARAYLWYFGKRVYHGSRGLMIPLNKINEDKITKEDKYLLIGLYTIRENYTNGFKEWVCSFGDMILSSGLCTNKSSGSGG